MHAREMAPGSRHSRIGAVSILAAAALMPASAWAAELHPSVHTRAQRPTHSVPLLRSPSPADSVSGAAKLPAGKSGSAASSAVLGSPPPVVPQPPQSSPSQTTIGTAPGSSGIVTTAPTAATPSPPASVFSGSSPSATAAVPAPSSQTDTTRQTGSEPGQVPGTLPTSPTTSSGTQGYQPPVGQPISPSRSATGSSPTTVNSNTPILYGGGENTVQDCMALYTKDFHMSKADWRKICKRTLIAE